MEGDAVVTFTLAKPYYGGPCQYSDGEIEAAWQRLTADHPKVAPDWFKRAQSLTEEYMSLSVNWGPDMVTNTPPTQARNICSDIKMWMDTECVNYINIMHRGVEVLRFMRSGRTT